MIIFIIVCIGILVYSYIGYPLVLIILSKIIQKRSINIKEYCPLPKVCILIAAYNEEKVIREKIVILVRGQHHRTRGVSITGISNIYRFILAF